MKGSQRALRLTAQFSLLVALVATSAVLLLRTYLDDDDKVYRQGTVTEVLQQGPVTIGQAEWKLESLEIYTQLVDAEGKKIDVTQPAGSVVVLAKVAITPLAGAETGSSGFSCSAKLRDDRGNLWEGQGAYGLALPTSCSDDDHPFIRHKTGQLAQVYVIPQSAVPHLTGIQIEHLAEYRRVLLTR